MSTNRCSEFDFKCIEDIDLLVIRLSQLECYGVLSLSANEMQLKTFRLTFRLKSSEFTISYFPFSCRARVKIPNQMQRPV